MAKMVPMQHCWVRLHRGFRRRRDSTSRRSQNASASMAAKPQRLRRSSQQQLTRPQSMGRTSFTTAINEAYALLNPNAQIKNRGNVSHRIVRRDLLHRGQRVARHRRSLLRRHVRSPRPTAMSIARRIPGRKSAGITNPARPVTTFCCGPNNRGVAV